MKTEEEKKRYENVRQSLNIAKEILRDCMCELYDLPLWYDGMLWGAIEQIKDVRNCLQEEIDE